MSKQWGTRGYLQMRKTARQPMAIASIPARGAPLGADSAVAGEAVAGEGGGPGAGDGRPLGNGSGAGTAAGPAAGTAAGPGSARPGTSGLLGGIA